MAAWRPLRVSGHAWEAFALIGAGQATSAADVYAKLPFRGYSEEEYASSLQMLVQRGWLANAGDNFAVTPAGEQVRAQVEEHTDAYFYAPWSTLSDAEMDEVRQLLENRPAQQFWRKVIGGYTNGRFTDRIEPIPDYGEMQVQTFTTPATL